MICPDWQYPHCGTSSSAQARCTGCELESERPSMVTIRAVGCRSPTRIEQDLVTAPSRCTEQAPHCAIPQPYLVPVSPICSRITHSKGVSGSTSISWTFPLMFSVAMACFLDGLGRDGAYCNSRTC